MDGGSGPGPLSTADRLGQDIADACRTLDSKGATHEIERAQVKRGTGY
ncbi:hypothetical protein [Streptomyces sp. NPDC052192]